MRIEFKKVPFVEKEFSYETNSVKIEGTFCRMSPTLVKMKSKLTGILTVDCCACGSEFEIELDEDLNFVISAGPFEAEARFEEIVIESMDEHIDFDEIINSELESIKSEYHTCIECEEASCEVDHEI